MKNLVNYALAYASKGLSVLPMIDKKPLISFADKPPLTDKEIKVQWTIHPEAQIAVRTTKFFVIDIDTADAHGKDGFKSIETVKDMLPETLMQETASGGRQMFYLKPPNVEVNQHIEWLPGVDVKAHENNYVMIAPSERNGKPYKWLNKLPIVQAPTELVRSINKRPNGNYTGSSNVNSYTGDKTATSNLFEQIVNGLGETGGRNNALASFVGGLLFRNVDVDSAYKLAQMANDNTRKLLSPTEFDRTFESMVKKEIRRREVANGLNEKIKGHAKD